MPKPLFVSLADVLSGAASASPAGSKFVTNNSSYDNIPNIIGDAFNGRLAPSELIRLTNAVNNDFSRNEYAGEGALQPVAIGMAALGNGSTTFSSSYSKGEPSAGGETVFAIKSGLTLANINISTPTDGRTYALDKADVRVINNKYLQAAPDSSGFKLFSIRPADYDSMSGFVGKPKVTTVATGAEAFLPAVRGAALMQ